METAAAILTKLAFEYNDRRKSQLNAFNAGSPRDVGAVMVPVSREILAALQRQSANGGENPGR